MLLRVFRYQNDKNSEKQLEEYIMKKATIGLIGGILILIISNNSWAHSGLRIDLGNNGFGFSVSDGPVGYSTFWYNTHSPQFYGMTTPYPVRPYLGWGGYRGNNHIPHKHWGHHHVPHRHFKGNHHGHKYGKKNKHFRGSGHREHYRNPGSPWNR